jgi:hypothetical protein
MKLVYILLMKEESNDCNNDCECCDTQIYGVYTTKENAKNSLDEYIIKKFLNFVCTQSNIYNNARILNYFTIDKYPKLKTDTDIKDIPHDVIKEIYNIIITKNYWSYKIEEHCLDPTIIE